MIEGNLQMIFEKLKEQYEEFKARKEIISIREKYKYIELTDDYDMSKYTAQFNGTIYQLAPKTINAFRGIQSNFKADNTPEAQLMLNAFDDEINTTTTCDIIVFRHHGFDMTNRHIYSTSMSWDFIFNDLADKHYKDIHCLIIPKGSVIIPTASIISYDKTGTDSEKEIIVNSRYITRIGKHLWKYQPK